MDCILLVRIVEHRTGGVAVRKIIVAEFLTLDGAFCRERGAV
jgi:hypothetical protein